MALQSSATSTSRQSQTFGGKEQRPDGLEPIVYPDWKRHFNQERVMKILIIFNREPYDNTDVTWNGLQIGRAHV